MIKVNRISKPKELTAEIQKSLTEEFKKDKNKSVWNKTYIRSALLKECHNKCVYCESIIGKGNKDMHVDHFHYKDKYADEVVAWENLNPSCPQCNRNKSTHDTYVTPIINPFEQDPKDYFYLKNYRYYSRNDEVYSIVQTSIDVLGLNDTEEIVKYRFALGETLSDKLKQIYEKTCDKKDVLATNVAEKNKILKGCKNILKNGIKTAEFAAFMATIIMNDDYYKRTKSILIELNLWDDELATLHQEVSSVQMNNAPDMIA